MSETIEQIPVDKLTKAFIKIRDKRSEMTAEFKRQDDALKTQQDRIKRALLDYCKEQNLTSVKTDAGTVIRTVKSTYWTSDWDSMYDFIIKHEVPEFFTKSLNQSNVKTFMEEHPDITPPGLNVSSEYQITIRKPTKKA